MTATIDLNADVGEAADPAGGAVETALMGVVTTVHVACGFHAGDPEVMRRTVAAAVEAGVAVGAHPSYPDREGFGRRDLDRHADRVAEDVLHQVGALQAVAAALGAPVVSVKAHGALYHRLWRDPQCAGAVASALAAFGNGWALVLPAPASGEPAAAAEARRIAGATGLPVRGEAFCDRAYRRDGSLVPRGERGALLTDPASAAAQALALVRDGGVPVGRRGAGGRLEIRPDTLCVHGDTPGALEIAFAVRARLEASDVVVVAPAPGS